MRVPALAVIGGLVVFGKIMLADGAVAATTDFPPELLVDGKPLEPYCMNQFLLGASLQMVDMRDCDMKDIEPSQEAGFNKDDEYGYEYGYKGDDWSPSKSFIYYQYLGMYDGLPVVMVKGTGGANGQMVVLMTLQREGDKLKMVEEFAGGDRCSGGIVDPRIEEGKLKFDRLMTPYDFLIVSENNIHEIDAYDDLEASFVSCFGKASYENGLFKEIKLTAKGKHLNTYTEEVTYQNCFNRIYKEYLHQGVQALNHEGLKAFTQTFNKLCIEQKN
jgi:hypothetical protein